MLSPSFISGICLIILAMGLRWGLSPEKHSEPAQAEAPVHFGNDTATESVVSPKQIERQEPPVNDSARVTEGLDTIPLEEPAPSLDAFADESVASLEWRMACYLERKDYERALLACERLIERGKTHAALLNQWSELQAKAPLWNPDFKQRTQLTLTIAMRLPPENSIEIAQLSKDWEESLFNATGGLFVPKISITLSEAKDCSLRLNEGPWTPIAPPAKRAEIEATLSELLRAETSNTSSPPTPLHQALTRLQWSQRR